MKALLRALLSISLAATVVTAVSHARAQSQDSASQESETSSAGTEESSIADILEGSSGVRVATMCTNCNVANVTMDGQSGTRVQVLSDGLPVVGGLGAIYLLSVCPQEAIASTEVIRGAGTVVTGSEAAVGAVALKTRDPGIRKDSILSAAIDFGSLSWNSQKVLGSGRKGRWGGTFALTRSDTDGSDPNGDGYFELGAAKRTTYGGTGTVEFAKGSYLRLDAVGYDEQQRDNKGGPITQSTFHRENVDIRRNEAGLGFHVTLPDRSKLMLSGRWTDRNQDTDDDDAGVTQPYMNVDETDTVAAVIYERTIADRHLLTAGSDYTDTQVSGLSWKGPLAAPLTSDDHVRHLGVSTQIELTLPQRFDLIVGVRWDEFRMNGTQSGSLFPPSLLPPTYERVQARFQPRIRLAWKAADFLSMSLAAGDALIAPPPVFERVCCGATVLPNNFVLPESSRNYLLDIDMVPERWLKIRTSFFRNEYTEYLQKFAAFSINWVPSFGNVNYSEFALQGAEIAVDFRFLERLSFGAQWTGLQVKSDGPITVYALGDVLTTLPDGKIINVPDRQASAFVRWDDPKAGWHATLQAQFTGSLLTQLLPATAGFGVVNEYWQTPSFWTYNARLEKRVWKWISVFGGVDNIGNYVQTNLADARYEYNWGPLRGRYYYAGAKFEM